MRHGVIALSIATVVAAACGGTSPSGEIDVGDRPTSTPIGGDPPTTTEGPVLIPGGFDFDRVRLMDAADLPAGIPVPVPFGGTIDDLHSVSEGQSLIVRYDPRFFATAAAFYQTWIRNEGIDASPRLSFADDAVGWDLVVDGVPVELTLTIDAEENATELIILWP